MRQLKFFEVEKKLQVLMDVENPFEIFAKTIDCGQFMPVTAKAF